MATLIRGRELGDWVARFNEVGIARTLMPPQAIQGLVTSAGCVLASDLRRSRESARLLAPSRDIWIDPDLREADLPSSMVVAFPLPVGMWIVIARVAWWLNWFSSRESIVATRARAERVTTRLCAMADQHGTVAVIGHGMFNRFIATELSERGWRGPKFLPSGHWTAARFTRSAVSTAVVMEDTRSLGLRGS